MHATLPASPLAPGVSPVSIHYRTYGTGPPLVILHGGWGYDVYPFDRQIGALEGTHRIVIPDRTGYGGSGMLDTQRVDFHQRAADETLALLETLRIDRPLLWGHSDGAVIALRLAVAAPDRVGAIVAEATHFLRRKPGSRPFFETMRDKPDQLGDRVVTTLQREHGNRWRALISTNGAAWLQIADDAESDADDLYEGQLRTVKAPILLIHGAKDPRTEPGEFTALVSALGPAVHEATVLPEGGHSPHSERASADAVTAVVQRFSAATRVAQGFNPATGAAGFSPATPTTPATS